MLLKAISLSPATANYHANLGMVTITLKLLVTGIYSQLYPMCWHVETYYTTWVQVCTLYKYVANWVHVSV